MGPVGKSGYTQRCLKDERKDPKSAEPWPADSPESADRLYQHEMKKEKLLRFFLYNNPDGYFYSSITAKTEDKK